MEPGDQMNVNQVEAGGVQGGFFVNSQLLLPTFNIDRPEQKIVISPILSTYNNWIKVSNSQLRRKIDQLNVNGEFCHIERKLSLRNGREISVGAINM